MMGRGRFFAAIALREAMAALSRVSTDEARRCIATAMDALVAAIRAEPDKVPQIPAPVRAYWVDPD
jgi:hypothetical protein